MAECITCEHCDMITNECLLNKGKCYKDGICLHSDCNEYVGGIWTLMQKTVLLTEKLKGGVSK